MTQRISGVRCRVACSGVKATTGRSMSGSIPSRGLVLGVMTGVLVLPPPVAHADKKAPEDEADPVVPPARAEDLPVRGVMPEERGLGEQERETQTAVNICHHESPIQMKPTTQAARMSTAPISLAQ